MCTKLTELLESSDPWRTIHKDKNGFFIRQEDNRYLKAAPTGWAVADLLSALELLGDWNADNESRKRYL